MNDSFYLQDAGSIILGAEAYIVYKNTLLLHKRSKTKKTFPGWWIAPGGHIDQGEDALTAILREVKEETGVVVNEKNVQLKSVAFHHHIDRKEVYILFIFRADIPEEQQVQLPNQEGESKWISIDEVLHMDNVFPASKYYFDHVLHNKDGILYTNMEVENSAITKIVSSRVDVNK